MDDTTLIPRAELQSLALLPPTSELFENLERLKSSTRAMIASPRLIKAAEARVRDGEERDRLQEQRPADCECLGLGWKDRLFCACPEGVAAKAEQDARMAAWLRRDVASYIDRAGIPKRFREFTFDTYPGSATLRDEVRHAEGSVFMYGSFGGGKTSLAVSLLKARIEKKCSAGLFTTVPNLLDAIRATYSKDSEQSEAGLVERVKRVPTLVLDDIGAEKVTDWVQEKLFSIVNHRHDECLDTIFTSNLTVDQLGQHIGERTVWRIVEMCRVVNVSGRNLRA